MIASLSWIFRLPHLSCGGGWGVIFSVIFYMSSFALAPPLRPLIGEWLQGQVILAFHLPLLVFRTRGVGVVLNDSDLGLLLGLLSARRGRECAGVGLQGRQSFLRPLLHTIPVVEPAPYASTDTITTAATPGEVIGSSRARSRGRSHALEIRELLLVPCLQLGVGTHLMDVIAVRKEHALLGKEVAAREGDVARLTASPTT